MIRIAPILGAIMLAGCQQTTTASNRVTPPTMHRIDGRSASSSPELTVQAKRDMAICKAEGQKAVLGARPLIYSVDFGENIANDQIAHTQRKQMVDIYVGCMAERGYLPGDGPATVTQ